MLLGRMARAPLLRQRPLALGQALTAGLRAGLLAKQVSVWLGAPMTGLRLRDGRVAGVETAREGRAAVIGARRGLVLAAGGFERNEQMRRRYQRARSASNGPPARRGTPATRSSRGNVRGRRSI